MAKFLRAAAAGCIAFLAANVVSNILFFQLGAGILFDPAYQSAKLLGVLFENEPRPLMFENGPLYMAIAAAIGIVHGLIFMLVEPALGRSSLARGLWFAVVIWALLALYFEFHAPFNMFREPVALVVLELFFWAIVALVEGIAIAFIYGKSRADPAIRDA